MEQKYLLYAVVVLHVTSIIALICCMDQVDKYQYYYKSTEALLDTLENHYNWVDAIDNDAYYDAISELNNK